MARKELLFYGLLQSLSILAVANADFNGTSLDKCMDFDLAQIEEYTSMLGLTPNFPMNFTSSSQDDREILRPFGTFNSDWSRLNLLHDGLPDNSTLKNKFKHLFRLLLIAHELVTKSPLPAETHDQFQNNHTRLTPESIFTQERMNMEKIHKQTTIIESEEFLSSISPSQKTGENFETIIPTSGDSTSDDFDNITSSIVPMLENLMTVSILKPKDRVDSATMINTSESTTLDYEEEKNTTSTVLGTENGLVKTSKIFKNSTPTVTMSDLFSNTSFDTQINKTATTIVTEPRETWNYKKTVIPISTSISDEEIISSSNHENISLISGQFMSTEANLRPTTAEKGTNSSDGESRAIFGMTPNLTSGTRPILKNEFEQPSPGVEYSSTETISNFHFTKMKSLPSTPNQKLLTSTKMAADNTLRILPSTTEISINSAKTESLGSTTAENVPISTIGSAENSMDLQSSIITHPAKQFSTPEEYSSETTFIKSPTTQNIQISIPNEGLSTSRDRKLEKTSWKSFSTPEEYSSETTFIKSPTTQNIQITTPNEGLSTSRERKLEKTSWKPFSTSEEYSSETTFIKSPTTQNIQISTPNEGLSTSRDRKLEKTWSPFMTSGEYSSDEIIVYSTTPDGQAPIMTLSEENSELTNQKGEKTLRISSSITADPMKELTNTESPISINNVTLQVSGQEEPFLNEKQTQSTLKVGISSASVASTRIQKPSTIPISPQVDISEDVLRTISSTENDEIKTTSYDDRTEIFMHELANDKSNVFTSSSEIFIVAKDLIGSTERADFPKETNYFGESATITTLEKSTEGSRSSKYTNKWETSQSPISRNNLTSESWKNETGSTTESTNNNTSAITEQIETSSYLETSTIKARPNYVKNPLNHSPSRNNNIFRDYKHDSEDTGSQRNAGSPQIVLYELGAGSRNRSIWRPHLAREPPVGNNIWRFDTFVKNTNPSRHQLQSTSMENINANVRQEADNSTKWPFHARTNVLRSRKRGSANENIEKQFIWFYRQAGQSEDRDKSRGKENDDTKIKIQCNNSQRR